MRNLIAKVTKKNKIVIIVGCYCQNFFNYLKKQSNLHIILGNNNKNKIVPFLQNYFKNNRIIRKYTPTSKLTKFESLSLPKLKFGENTRAFLKIQDGCDNRCSYCIIPFGRGKSRSADPDFIIKEINRYVENGYKEVVITGIHIGLYEGGLLNLLKKIFEAASKNSLIFSFFFAETLKYVAFI